MPRKSKMTLFSAAFEFDERSLSTKQCPIKREDMKWSNVRGIGLWFGVRVRVRVQVRVRVRVRVRVGVRVRVRVRVRVWVKVRVRMRLP